MEDLLVGFEIVQIGIEGTAAVDWQSSVVERNAVERRAGLRHRVVTFASTEWIGEALRGRAFIGRTIRGLCVADMNESIVVVGSRYGTNDLSMWLRWEARTVLEVNTGPRMTFELAQVPLWLWL